MKNIDHYQILDAIKHECALRVTLRQDEAKRFFKTEKGSYGAHDAFLGISVPALRSIAVIYSDINFTVLKGLLSSKYNEERLLALIILVHQYQRSSVQQKEKIYQFYCHNIRFINNWNLVDASAHLIMGAHLFEKDCSILLTLAQSDYLWERRIAVVSTWYFIRQSQLEWTFKIAVLLRQDKHDLIHKAVGWMLREAGKKDENQLIDFLCRYIHCMPKTMARYAMERLSKEQRYAIKDFYRKDS